MGDNVNRGGRCVVGGEPLRNLESLKGERGVERLVGVQSTGSSYADNQKILQIRLSSHFGAGGTWRKRSLTITIRAGHCKRGRGEHPGSTL